MCVIMSIDHMPCDHTIAIWQHCANAPRSVFGHKPCSHIRQHGRPIITRKMCHNCGGPRFFARRGGLAARGSGGSMLGQVKEQEEDLNEQYDSGYQSDLLPETDDQFDDDLLSPRQSTGMIRKWRDFARQRSPNIPRSSGQKSNWRPNLKRDLGESSSESSLASSRRVSVAPARELLYTDAETPSFSSAPVVRCPSPPRKGSTLLHPSPPLQEPFQRAPPVSAPAVQDLTPPTTPPSRPAPPKRQDSTLLHPSTPGTDTAAHSSEATGFPFTIPSPAPSTPVTVPTSAPRRPGLPPRKQSTLLHPSSPSDETPSPLPVLAKTIISLPPTPQATPPLGSLKRYPSVHSTTSEDDWEGPLHSSHSDGEDDSDDDESVGTVVVESARRVPLLQAAQRPTSFSFRGNQLLILRD